MASQKRKPPKIKSKKKGRSRYDKLCQRVGADVGAGVMAASFEAGMTTKQKTNECEGGRNGESENKREMTKYSQAEAELFWQAGA